jgi:hypothetical protein
MHVGYTSFVREKRVNFWGFAPNDKATYTNVLRMSYKCLKCLTRSPRGSPRGFLQMSWNVLKYTPKSLKTPPKSLKIDPCTTRTLCVCYAGNKHMLCGQQSYAMRATIVCGQKDLFSKKDLFRGRDDYTSFYLAFLGNRFEVCLVIHRDKRFHFDDICILVYVIIGTAILVTVVVLGRFLHGIDTSTTWCKRRQFLKIDDDLTWTFRSNVLDVGIPVVLSRHGPYGVDPYGRGRVGTVRGTRLRLLLKIYQILQKLTPFASNT